MIIVHTHESLLRVRERMGNDRPSLLNFNIHHPSTVSHHNNNFIIYCYLCRDLRGEKKKWTQHARKIHLEATKRTKALLVQCDQQMKSTMIPRAMADIGPALTNEKAMLVYTFIIMLLRIEHQPSIEIG